MTHIMLDLETMGNSSNAAITAIGAVKFDIANGITDSFYLKVDLESAVALGGKMDPSTVIWWLGQNDAADLRRVLRTSESDVEIERAIAEAIDRKPKGHDFVIERGGEGPSILRHMSTTGG